MAAATNDDHPTITGTEPRRRDWGEAFVNNAVQLAGLATAVAGSLVLLAVALRLTSPPLVVGVVLYAIGLLAMLGCSTLYHIRFHGPNSHIYKVLDHLAIFVMIAGTYSPIALGVIGGSLGLGLFAAEWALALAGIVIRLAWPGLFDRLAVALYLAMGWLVLLALPWLIDAMPWQGVALIGAGGVVYTAGVPFHRLHRLRYHDAIWHGFVVVAAGLHYVAILYDVVLPRA